MPDLVTYKAPWGGFNSSLPEDKLEAGDFPFMSNFIIRDGELRTRLEMLDAPVQFAGVIQSHIITTISAVGFRNVANGAAQGRIFLILADGNLYEEDLVNGYLNKGHAISGTTPGLIPYIMYNNVLYSAVGSTQFKWDGTTFTSPLPNWVASGFFLGTIANHGVLANTQEGGNNFPQRVRWSAVGNLDQWNPATDNTAGVQDLLEIEDYITGLITSTSGEGWIVRSSGITRMIATGSGSRPWDFVHINNKGSGCEYYGSLDSYGDWSVYLGRDDIYSLDSGALSRIGGKAKSRIYKDLQSIANTNFNVFNNPPSVQANPNIIGSIVPAFSIGYPYLCYILAIPMGGTAGSPPTLNTVFWVYYKELGIWERFTASNGWLQCRMRTVKTGGSIVTMAPMKRWLQTA